MRITVLQVTVQYQVVQESIYDAFYRLTNARAQITAYVFDVVRAIVPKSNLDDVFLTKEEVRCLVCVKQQLLKITIVGVKSPASPS